MQDFKPSISDQDIIICAETTASPTAMVVFGASGDLVSRKLLPSLMQIFQRQLLDDRFYFLGAGRKNLSDQQFREITRQSVNIPAKDSDLFLKKLYYVSGDYADSAFYESIKTRLRAYPNNPEQRNVIMAQTK